MVHLMGGYPLDWEDAKAWALRHWPDIDIYDDRMLPSVVRHHNKMLGGNLDCIAVDVDYTDQPVFFIVICTRMDPLSTRYQYRRFPEGTFALKAKELLFSHEGDKGLAEKTKFVTIVDPFNEAIYMPKEMSVLARSHENDARN